MVQDKDTDKTLRNMIRLRRWIIIGGLAVGAQALLSALTNPESKEYVFHSILAIVFIGYGISMTPKIRRIRQDAGGTR